MASWMGEPCDFDGEGIEWFSIGVIVAVVIALAVIGVWQS